jgi:NIMA (never in mitosis gene a)-related kinase
VPRLSVVKIHKSTVTNREREVLAREAVLREKEQQLASALSSKDNEIAALQQMVAQLEQQQHRKQYSQQDVEMTIKEAVARREEELRVLVMKREAEVAEAMARREEEIMEAVRKREAEVFEEWRTRETDMQQEIEEKIKELEARVDWIQAKEEELTAEDARLETVRIQLEGKIAKWEENAAKGQTRFTFEYSTHLMSCSGRKEKTPLEEVKNLLVPLARLAQETPSQRRQFAIPTPKPPSNLHAFPSLATPVTRPAKHDYMQSAMKGVVLTATGETLATPTPAELANLFNNSPKVGLNFAKIFDFGDGDDDDEDNQDGKPAGVPTLNEHHSPPPSPTSRKEREKASRTTMSDPGSSTSTSTTSATAPPTRLRRPSIRTSNRPALNKTTSLPSSISDPTGLSVTSTSSSSTCHVQPKPLPHPHLHSAPTTAARAVTFPRSHPSPEYDFADEENLPSPFLKRTVDRGSVKGTTSVRGTKKRPSSGHSLRAVAAANAAGKRSAASSAVSSPALTTGEMMNGSGTPGIAPNTRPSVTSARKAGEEARKALSRS